jgi:hypothetical protein
MNFDLCAALTVCDVKIVRRLMGVADEDALTMLLGCCDMFAVVYVCAVARYRRNTELRYVRTVN